MDLHSDNENEMPNESYMCGLFSLIWAYMQDIAEAKEFLAKNGVDVGFEWGQFRQSIFSWPLWRMTFPLCGIVYLLDSVGRSTYFHYAENYDWHIISKLTYYHILLLLKTGNKLSSLLLMWGYFLPSQLSVSESSINCVVQCHVMPYDVGWTCKLWIQYLEISQWTVKVLLIMKLYRCLKTTYPRKTHAQLVT
jgi:hypothetical protein